MLIEVENDNLFISTSPIISNIYNYSNKFYKLFEYYNNDYDYDDNIIINASFLYNGGLINDNDNNKKYYKNVEYLYIYINKKICTINIQQLNISNLSEFQDFFYTSEIINIDNIQYWDILIMLDNPIIINISIDSKFINLVSITFLYNDKSGGTKNKYIYYNYPFSIINNFDETRFYNNNL
jgi:hypothetical protein